MEIMNFLLWWKVVDGRRWCYLPRHEKFSACRLWMLMITCKSLTFHLSHVSLKSQFWLTPPPPLLPAGCSSLWEMWSALWATAANGRHTCLTGTPNSPDCCRTRLVETGQWTNRRNCVRPTDCLKFLFLWNNYFPILMFSFIVLFVCFIIFFMFMFYIISDFLFLLIWLFFVVFCLFHIHKGFL